MDTRHVCRHDATCSGFHTQIEALILYVCTLCTSVRIERGIPGPHFGQPEARRDLLNSRQNDRDNSRQVRTCPSLHWNVVTTFLKSIFVDTLFFFFFICWTSSPILSISVAKRRLILPSPAGNVALCKMKKIAFCFVPSHSTLDEFC